MNTAISRLSISRIVEVILALAIVLGSFGGFAENALAWSSYPVQQYRMGGPALPQYQMTQYTGSSANYYSSNGYYNNGYNYGNSYYNNGYYNNGYYDGGYYNNGYYNSNSALVFGYSTGNAVIVFGLSF